MSREQYRDWAIQRLFLRASHHLFRPEHLQGVLGKAVNPLREFSPEWEGKGVPALPGPPVPCLQTQNASSQPLSAHLLSSVLHPSDTVCLGFWNS